MNSSPLRHSIIISLILSSFRVICFYTEFDIGYFNDLLYFLVFGFSVVIYQKNNPDSSFIRTFLIPGGLQILLTIVFYEFIRRLVLVTEAQDNNWLNRIIIASTIIFIGLTANSLFLAVYKNMKRRI